MHLEDGLQNHAAISRRDSHYSGQRTVLSYSTSRSRRHTVSLDNGNHSDYNTQSGRSSRPGSIRYLDSENFTLTDEYSFINGRDDTGGTGPLSNGSLSYIDKNIARHESSQGTTNAPLIEDKKPVNNFSRKGSLTSMTSKKGGKNYGHKNGTVIKTWHNDSNDNQIISTGDLPGTGCYGDENIQVGSGGGAGSSGNGFEAFVGQWPSVPGSGAKTEGDLLTDHVDQNYPSNLALDDNKVPEHHIGSLNQDKKTNARVRADVVSPAIHLTDWPQISYGASNSRPGKDASNAYDRDVEEFYDDVPFYSAQHSESSTMTNLARWKVTEKFALLGYLIIFSMLGTLARIGLKKLTFYPGAPVSTCVLWANFTGCFILGFLSREAQFIEQNSSLAQRQHTGLKRYGHSEKMLRTATATEFTTSLYIGLTTGFCGSLTSFSALMHDAFLSVSNDLPGLGSDMGTFGYDEVRAIRNSEHSRSAFYSILAVLATILINAALSIAAFLGGQHLAGGISSALPMLPRLLIGIKNASRGGKGKLDTINIAIMITSILLWSTIVIFASLSTTLNISSTTRTTILFPLAFAPPGCLLRYSLSILNRPFQRRTRELSLKYSAVVNQTGLLNGPPRPCTPWQRFSTSKVVSTVCLGTLIANLLGTLIFSLSWDFQHGLGYGSGTSHVTSTKLSLLSCQVLAGIQDGFCGALTTVSTLVQELVSIASAPKGGQGQRGRLNMQQQNSRAQELQQTQGERWWVPHREQRQEQRRRQEIKRTEQRRIRRRRSLESAPAERDLSRLELREIMKPRARFIESARSNYRDYGDEEDQDGRNNNNSDGSGPFHDEGIVVVDQGCDQRAGNGLAYCEYRIYKRAYAYGIGTLLAGLVVVIAVMGPVRWWLGGWDEGLENGTFCFG